MKKFNCPHCKKDSVEEYDKFIQLFEELVGIKFPFEDDET